MTRLNGQDMPSCEAVFRSYGKEVFRLLYRLTGNRYDGEDLTQETFLAVMKKLPTFRGESSLRTWVYAIAINRFRDSRRYAGHRAAAIPAALEQPPLEGPHEELVARETAERVRKAFYSLPEEQRTAFALVRFEGMAYREAAEAAGTTTDTIRMRVHRAHRMLAARLRDGVS